MLDPNFIKDNLKKVKENIAARCMQVDADKAVSLYESKKKLLTEVEKLRQQRNDNAARMKTGLTPQQRTELIAAGKKLKKDISACEARLQQLEPQLQEVMSAIPNMSHPDVPPGKEEKDNLELHRQGDIPVFTFQPLDHVKLGSKLDILDFETAASISGPKFYFLKNQGAFLELALIRFAMDKLNSLGFSVTITPDIAKEKIVKGIGFNPRGPESNIYN
ncbi:MAG TPA: serine--tRNA ligase, partial [Spirochaetota bacterium]|nr:serine--tRNA ligase [Spirochaetota bacterium]